MLIKNCGALVAFAALFCLGVAGILISQPSKKSPDYKQRREQKENTPTEVEKTAPGFVPFKLFTNDGRDEIAKYCAAYAEEETHDWPHKYVCDVRITDAYIAFFGALLVIVTGGLVCIGYMQIKTTRAQLRAYVFVSEAKIVHGIADDNILEALVEIKNSGQTPAYRMTVVTGLAFSPYPPPQSLPLTVPDKDYLSLVRTRMDLGPGGKMFPVTRGRPLTSEEKANLVAGTKAVWVYGEIRYRDAFCRKQWTTYRLIIGGPFGVSGGDLFGCEEGNKAT